MVDKEKETQEEKVDEQIEPVIILQFVYHPTTNEITFEASEGVDITDLSKCHRLLRDYIDDAKHRLDELSLNYSQQILNKENAILEAMKLLLKTQMEQVQQKGLSSVEKKYKTK